MRYGERIARGSIELFIITAVATAIGYGTRIFLARNLSTEEFGLFYSVLAFAGFFFSLKSLGYRSAIARYIPEWIVKKNRDAINSSVWFGIIFQTFVGLVVFLFLFFGADFLAAELFKNSSAKFVLQVISVEMLISVMFMREILQGFQKMFHFGSVELSRNIIILLFAVPFVGMGAFGISLGYLFASVIVQIIFFYYIFSKLLKRFNPVFRFSRVEKPVFFFGITAFASTIAAYAISYADTVLLTGLKTLVDVGMYQAALPTSQILMMFATPVGVIMLPVFSEMWAGGQKAALARGVNLSLKLIMLLIIGPVMVVAAWPDLIIFLLFGQKFLSASFALQILVFGSVFYSLMMVNTTLLSAIEKPAAFAKTFIAAAVANIILNIILIPPFGIAGAAAASVFSYIIAFSITTIYVKKYIQLGAPWVSIFKIIFSSVVTLVAMTVTKAVLVADVYVEVAATVAVFLLSYAFLLKILRVLDKNDIQDMENMGVKLPVFLKKFLMW